MTNLISILKKYDIKTSVELSDIEWKTQNSHKGSILFYKFNKKDASELSIFSERIKNAQYGICITNNKTDQSVEVSDENFVKLQEDILNLLYPLEKERKFFGVTGTNGKTTTVDLIRQLSLFEKKTILTVGTLGLFLNDKVVENFSLTSPAYIDLRKALYKYPSDLVAMEMSSIALEQNRFGSIKFERIAWTNFSQDHLDYHGDMQEYLNAKKLVGKFSDAAILLPETQKDLLEKLSKMNIETVPGLIANNNSFLKVQYNQENYLLACHLLGVIPEKYIGEIKPPPGRFNIIEYQDSYIIIDYAHTPEAIEMLIEAVKKEFSGYEIITLFGCGGDRDRGKRPLMAMGAEKLSDKIVLTSDNPRFEDPLQIIEDAKKGLKKAAVIEVDRKTAIVETIKELNNSVLIIAGKGHEDYLDIKGVKYPYSDEQVVKEYIYD